MGDELLARPPRLEGAGREIGVNTSVTTVYHCLVVSNI
jgi:hypothetical protein